MICVSTVSIVPRVDRVGTARYWSIGEDLKDEGCMYWSQIKHICCPIELIFSPSHPCPVSTAVLLVGSGMGLFRGGSMRRIRRTLRWDVQVQ